MADPAISCFHRKPEFVILTLSEVEEEGSISKQIGQSF